MARTGKTAKMTVEQHQQHAQSLKQGNVPEQPVAMAQATAVEKVKVTKESHVSILTTHDNEGDPTKCGETFYCYIFPNVYEEDEEHKAHSRDFIKAGICLQCFSIAPSGYQCLNCKAMNDKDCWCAALWTMLGDKDRHMEINPMYVHKQMKTEMMKVSCHELDTCFGPKAITEDKAHHDRLINEWTNGHKDILNNPEEFYRGMMDKKMPAGKREKRKQTEMINIDTTDVDDIKKRRGKN